MLFVAFSFLCQQEETITALGSLPQPPFPLCLILVTPSFIKIQCSTLLFWNYWFLSRNCRIFTAWCFSKKMKFIYQIAPNICGKQVCLFCAMSKASDFCFLPHWPALEKTCSWFPLSVCFFARLIYDWETFKTFASFFSTLDTFPFPLKLLHNIPKTYPSLIVISLPILAQQPNLKFAVEPKWNTFCLTVDIFFQENWHLRVCQEAEQQRRGHLTGGQLQTQVCIVLLQLQARNVHICAIYPLDQILDQILLWAGGENLWPPGTCWHGLSHD